MAYGIGDGGKRQLSEAGPNAPIYRATFSAAVRQYFSKYAQFKGYASRSEYWWVQLFQFLVIAIIGTPYYRTYDTGTGSFDLLQGSENVEGWVLASAIGMFVWGVVTLLPSLALHWRRFHDAGLPGPVYFLILIPVLGGLIIFAMALLPPRPEKRSPQWEDCSENSQSNSF